MRICCLWTGLLLWTAPLLTVCAEIQIVPSSVQHVFGGAARQIRVQLQNTGDAVVMSDIQTVLSQASSATVVRVSDTQWKRLQVLPHQTIVETAALDLPAVKVETRFLVQWVEGASNVVGKTEVLVYPTNLLTQLKPLAGDKAVGLFDPGDRLKPLLHSLTIEFHDLVEEGTDKFHGKLAIFGPFESKSQMRASLKNDIQTLARRGVAVVWLLPPPEKRAPLQPSFYGVPLGDGMVIVAQAQLVSGLAERPEAQLNLLRLAEESLHPTSLTLPETETAN